MGKSSRKKKKSSGGIGPGEGGVESPRDLDNTHLPQKHLTHGTQNVNYFIAASVSVITFIVYLSSLKNEFIFRWDDGLYILDNPFISAFNINLFKQSFFGFYGSNWHPLTWISHALDYAVWGLNPLGHHLTNNILHAVNTFLVVLLLVRLIETVLSRQPSSGRVVEWSNGRVVELSSGTTQRLNYSTSSLFALIAAAVTGLLFGLHPLHVESVAWVAERKDLLCGLFYLLSVMMYSGYVCRGGPVWPPKEGQPHRVAPTRTYIFSLSFFILALLSKPMAVSLPVVLLILDWYPFKRIQSLKTLGHVFLEKLPFIALSLISSVLTVLAQKTGGALASMEAVPLSSRLLVAAHSLPAYLWKMISPVALIPYYPYPKDVSLFSLEYLSAVVFAAVIPIACMVMAKRRKILLSVWGYYVVTLIPVLGIVQVGGQSMADRYMYLPSLGPFLMIGLMVAWISVKVKALTRLGTLAKTGSLAVGILVSGSIAYVTFDQIGVWKNSVNLWSCVIAQEPARVPVAYNDRGLAFEKMGQFDKAIEDYDKAIALDPVFYESYYNRGVVLEKMGLLDKAIEDYGKAISLNPLSYQAYNNRGVSYRKVGSFDKAIEDFDNAINIKSHFILYDNRGYTYYLIGRYANAVEDFSRAIALNATYTVAYFRRGSAYLKLGAQELALSDFQKACELGDQEGCNALNAIGNNGAR